MLYFLHDLQHALLAPARLGVELMRKSWQNPDNPLSDTPAGRTVLAYAELFERVTRRFEKPAFNLPETMIGGEPVAVTEEIVLEKPFCRLLHFKRDCDRKDPKLLIAAPMSGHFATLLRGTVEDLLPHHDIYITDWTDARQVPTAAGRFDLDDYIAYLREFMAFLGPDIHLIAVCQPAVPVFAAIALMEAENDPNLPRSMTLMGGPIDPRISKTQVTELAESRPIEWFENNVVADVPPYYPAAGRRVYPGFIQLTGFMSMNLDRHVGSHMNFFGHLVRGDGDPAAAHRKFYDEYLSVMDITAEFYLQTVETVFQKHLLPRGEMTWIDPATGKTHQVDPLKINRTALLTVEGEMDDISANGQTTSAHILCANLPAERQYHHFQENVGHYGIFNGRRWRTHIMPRIRNFVRRFDRTQADPVPPFDLELIADKVAARWDPQVHGVAAVRQRKASQDPATSEPAEPDLNALIE